MRLPRPPGGLPVHGSVAVITGASSGIGAAAAVEFARRGALVIAVARRADRLSDTVAECRRAGGRAEALALDVTDPEAPVRIRAEADRFGGVDVVVHSAGTGLHQPVLQTSAEEVQALVDVHLLAPIRLTTGLLPGMLERGHGAIVTITSISAALPAPGETAYGAVKAALARWTHGLATELHGTGVHACAVAPGPIDTELWDHVGRHYRGHLFPPQVVAQAVIRSVEHGGVQRHVPRRFGIVATGYVLAGAPVRAGVRLYSRLSGDGADG